ncbi:MAG: hypothetical protein ACSHW0_09625 [Thalassotalea sp.]
MIETIFYILFLSQIILFSVYFPNKIFQRMRHVITHYPYEQYPKLYPQPIDNYHRFHHNYRLANYMIAAVGLVILVVSVIFNSEGQIIEPQILVWLFFMVQFIPVITIELSVFSQFKMMRKANQSSVRSATLSPRSLQRFIAPKWIYLALTTLFVALVYGFYLEDFTIDINGSAVYAAGILLTVNVFFAGLIYWHLFGKKLNPHQTEEDRQKMISVAIKSLVFISISASIFLMASLSIKEFQLHSLEPVAMTIYLQVIAFYSLGSAIANFKIDELNFDLYKKKSLQ